MDPLTFASQLARQTGDLLDQYYHPNGIQARLKTDHTLVTAADLAADQHLKKAISEAYPQDGLLSEEEGTIYPENKEYVWIIDPLDGTTNFSLGLHYWGVAIARLKDGYPDLGVLYFPLLDELFAASRGGGAFLNGSQLRVDPRIVSLPATFFSCCSRTQHKYDVQTRHKTRILGSATYGLVTVARGSASLALEVTPKVWDISASWLITQEAGGIIAPLEGESPFPLVPGLDYEKKSYPLLVAATQEIWEEGQSKIRKR